jgi:hypothetical protein
MENCASLLPPKHVPSDKAYSACRCKVGHLSFDSQFDVEVLKTKDESWLDNKNKVNK